VDHDQFFKTLFQQFLPELIALRLGEWLDHFDFSQVEWLEQEVFPDPPAGRRRSLDLVAKVKLTEPVPGYRAGDDPASVLLIHTEVEAEDSVQELRGRFCDYYHYLRGKHNLPVLPLAVYLRVGLEGMGWDVYEEELWDRTLVRFEYPYIGLPALEALQHLHGDNWLAVALTALMKIPADQRAQVKVEAADRIAHSPLNEYRRYLLFQCVEAYLPLEGVDMTEYERLLRTERYSGAFKMATTSYEKGIEKARRAMIQEQLEEKFGQLSEPVRQRLEAWPADQLPALGKALLRANSLKELGLED
jgi:hypothetical protein